jgi:hypothetical protein
MVSSVLHTIHSSCQPGLRLLIGSGTLVITLQFASLHPQNYISWIFTWFVYDFTNAYYQLGTDSVILKWHIWPVRGLRIYSATNYHFYLSAVFLPVLISTSDYFCCNFTCRRIMVILSLASFLMLHLRPSNTFSNLCGLGATTQITSSGYSSVLVTFMYYL